MSKDYKKVEESFEILGKEYSEAWGKGRHRPVKFPSGSEPETGTLTLGGHGKGWSVAVD